MQILMLRLDAPLLAFGGVTVDENGVCSRFPARSMITGLLANALGWDQSDADRHTGLQNRLHLAARIDREGHLLEDFHTVNLGDPRLAAGGWTTRGQPERREGGTAKTGTHIRRMQYWADSCVTVALSLDPVPPDTPEQPTLDALAAALAEPARPLFLGRKACPPSGYLLAGPIRDYPSLLDALRQTLPPHTPQPVRARWSADDADQAPDSRGRHLVTVCEDRDWSTQVHTGQRTVWEGVLQPPPPAEGDRPE